MSTIATRLQNLGIELPTPAAPAANYVPFVRTGNLVFVSGQIPMGPKGLEFVG
ncbi:MAG: RidA family protein, partial [Siculibacillus sp.]